MRSDNTEKRNNRLFVEPHMHRRTFGQRHVGSGAGLPSLNRGLLHRHPYPLTTWGVILVYC